MCGKCIRCKAQTVQRMPESNLSRAHKQGCRLLCAFGERGRMPSQRTLRRGALAMLVRDNGPGLKKTIQSWSLVAWWPKYLPYAHESFFFSAKIAVKSLQLTHLDTWPTFITLQHVHPVLWPVLFSTAPGSNIYYKWLYIVRYRGEYFERFPSMQHFHKLLTFKYHI